MRKKIVLLLVIIMLVITGIYIVKNKEILITNNVSKGQAAEIASEYLNSKVSSEELNDLGPIEITYVEPHADDLPGTYEVKYSRIINGITSSDGVKIRVNAETGEVSSYRKSWSMNEDEIALIDTKPSISSSEATKIITDYMTNEPTIGKDKADTVKIISSELYWKEDNSETVHLAWGITFKDSTFEYADYPAETWIDAHSGKILLFAYSRD